MGFPEVEGEHENPEQKYIGRPIKAWAWFPPRIYNPKSYASRKDQKPDYVRRFTNYSVFSAQIEINWRGKNREYK